MAESTRLQQTKEAVEEVKIVMFENLEKAEERSGKLKDLDNRANLLRQSSMRFQKTSKKVEKQKKWENLKAKRKLIAIVVGTAVIIIIIFVIMYVNNAFSSPLTEEKSVSLNTTPGPGRK